ncbi:hypothetical protein VT06_07605 [Arsukibacterium sp. MJ3]|uniref:hypothetical protein n=1 Tax=Arsukibacterium sp. MJ3 TaxID=1632859 RepID=UPI00062740F5|nr:hypothetical protein [Arsukibacterium sp. MJ3]KKO49360.1 hypothetical protein VT06_07605 [Arsukibacterium sp. MJ3]
MAKIDRQQFPELDRLLWDTKERFFEEKEVLDIYERRWLFVDQRKLTASELKLISNLAQNAGGFLPAPGNPRL